MTKNNQTIKSTDECISEYLRLSLTHLGRHGIPVTPQNYAVWFEYVSGSKPALTRNIDSRIRQGLSFDSAVNEELYVRYIATADQIKHARALKDIKQILLGITESLINTGDAVSERHRELENCSKTLEQDLDIERIREVVRVIMGETQSIINFSKSLQNKFEITTREVEKLREDLETVKTKATIDSLTGISNRLNFEYILENEILKTDQNGRNLCLLFADIDFFKRFNDCYGHLVGDMVLKIAAAMIQGFIQPKDTVARFGGEEFVVILPETGLEQAAAVAEKIRSYFESKKWRQKDSGKSIGSVTLSLGVAQYRRGESVEELIKRADDALYLSKQNGRNQVSLESSSIRRS